MRDALAVPEVTVDRVVLVVQAGLAARGEHPAKDKVTFPSISVVRAEATEVSVDMVVPAAVARAAAGDQATVSLRGHRERTHRCQA